MDEVLLKTSSRKKRAAFVLYLLCGLAGFLIAASRLTVPVYETVEGTVLAGHTLICTEALPAVCAGEPAYVYETREDAIEKIEAYRIEGNRVRFEESTQFADGVELHMELPTGKVSLLWSIFRRGGAL